MPAKEENGNNLIKLKEELTLDDETVSYLMKKESEDATFSSFLTNLNRYFDMNSFGDLYYQFNDLKESLQTTRDELKKEKSRSAMLETSNEQLSQAKEEALNSIQLQIREVSYLKEVNSSTEKALKEVLNELDVCKNENFKMTLATLKAESDNKLLHNKNMLVESENRNLRGELSATKDILNSYRTEKEKDIQKLLDDLHTSLSECQMAKALYSEYKAKNKDLYHDLDEIKYKLQEAGVVPYKRIEELENEMSNLKQLDEINQQLANDTHLHTEFLKDQVETTKNEYTSLCVKVEMFQKEAILKHNALLHEIEGLKLQLNNNVLNSSNNTILDLSHSNHRIAAVNQANQIASQLDQLESDYKNISRTFKGQ